VRSVRNGDADTGDLNSLCSHHQCCREDIKLLRINYTSIEHDSYPVFMVNRKQVSLAVRGLKKGENPGTIGLTTPQVF
jgi:hypothetical protein